MPGFEKGRCEKGRCEKDRCEKVDMKKCRNSSKNVVLWYKMCLCVILKAILQHFVEKIKLPSIQIQCFVVQC